MAKKGYRRGDDDEGLAQERESGKEDNGARVKMQCMDLIMRKHGREEV